MSKIRLGLVLIFALVLSLPEKAHDGCVNDFLFPLLVRSLCLFPTRLRFVCRIHQNTAAGEAATGAAGVDRAGMAGM